MIQKKGKRWHNLWSRCCGGVPSGDAAAPATATRQEFSTLSENNVIISDERGERGTTADSASAVGEGAEWASSCGRLDDEHGAKGS